MGLNSPEWAAWCLINGGPALLAGIAFFVSPWFIRRFSWDPVPRQSQLFFGAGFLMRAGLFLTIFMTPDWTALRWIVSGNVVFAVILLLMTLVYGDHFHWSRPMAWIWLFLYVEEPVWMLTLVPEATAAAANVAAPVGLAVSALVHISLWFEVAVMTLAGVYVAAAFVLKRGSGSRWPWTPDLVSAGVMSGFLLGWATWAAVLAREPSWPLAMSGVRLNIGWLAVMLVTILIARSHFDIRDRRVQATLAALVLIVTGLGTGFIMQGG